MAYFVIAILTLFVLGEALVIYQLVNRLLLQAAVQPLSLTPVVDTEPRIEVEARERPKKAPLFSLPIK